MIDEKTWNVIVEIMSVIDHSRRPDDSSMDALGRIHLILFGELMYTKSMVAACRVPFVRAFCMRPGDLKQLPPATGHAPFIRLAAVHDVFCGGLRLSYMGLGRGAASDAARVEPP